ncbi:MAG: hypothetical protein FOGNACKC_05541 [Anaerolineae bacterium]|nr:hypothetical protein [Anaerolineae bacterium]
MRHTFLAKRRKGNPVSFHVITPYLPSLLGLLLLVSLFPGEGAALDLIRRVAAAVLGILRYMAWLPLVLAPLLRREQRLATAGWVAVASGLITLAGGAGGQVGVIVVGLATTPAGPLVGALVLSAAAVAIPVRLLPFPLPARLLPGLTSAAVSPPPVASPTATPAKHQPRLVDPAQPPLILPRPRDASPVVARWTLPPLPPPPPAQAGRVNAADHPPRLARTLTDTLNAFGVPGKVENWEVGPTITRYHFRLEQPANGRRVKVSRIIGLRDDLALALAASPVRIQAPAAGDQPGRHRSAQPEPAGDAVERGAGLANLGQRRRSGAGCGAGPENKRPAGSHPPGQSAAPAHRRRDRLRQVSLPQHAAGLAAGAAHRSPKPGYFYTSQVTGRVWSAGTTGVLPRFNSS